VAADPQLFFTFAARHYALLKDVYDASSRGGVNDAGLLHIIIQNRSEDDPNIEYVFNQLKSLNIIEECADASSKLTMTQHISTFLGFLLREHRLTSVHVIRGYLQEMAKNSDELDSAIATSDNDLCDLALTDLERSIEMMRSDSRNNRDALMYEALRLKQNRQQLSTEKRFTIVVRLWESYLKPMQEMIDISEAMDAQLDSLERLLNTGLKNRQLYISMQDKINTVLSTLTRMRRNISSDFRESLQNITPLYEKLHRESGLARGAAAALSIAHKRGIGSLNVNAQMRLSTFRTNELMDCPSILDYLYQVSEYDVHSEPHKNISSDRAMQHVYYLSPNLAVKKLLSELPVSDGMGWLAHAYSEASVTDVLRSYNRILRLKDVQYSFSVERKKIVINGFVLNYSPLSIKKQESSHA